MNHDPFWYPTVTAEPMPQSPGNGAEITVVPCAQCKYDNKCMLQSFVESEGVEPIDRQKWYCADGERKEETNEN